MVFIDDFDAKYFELTSICPRHMKNKTISKINHQIFIGVGAAGASGASVHRSFDGWRRYWEDAGCHGILGLVCGPSYHEQFGGFVPHFSDTECPGSSGSQGKPGDPWTVA